MTSSENEGWKSEIVPKFAEVSYVKKNRMKNILDSKNFSPLSNKHNVRSYKIVEKSNGFRTFG